MGPPSAKDRPASGDPELHCLLNSIEDLDKTKEALSSMSDSLSGMKEKVEDISKTYRDILKE